jgi:HEAT repeat protein
MAVAETRSPWWTWWERNRFDYLVPSRVREDGPVTGGDDFLAQRTARRLAGALASRRAEWVRGRVAPHLERHFRDPDYNLRASALVSAAKLEGAARVPALREGLRDAHAVVRDGALLGLGASASEEGAKILASIAADEREGRAALGEGGSISARTRAMALLALGICRARGGPNLATASARAVLEQRKGTGSLEQGVGACVALGLARSEEGVPDLLRAASDRDEPSAVRCRALAALGAIADASARPTATQLLGDRDRLVRGAAALALGDLVRAPDPEAAGRLLAFLEKEEDPTVSAFALVSLGKTGAEAAAKELARQLVRGKDARRAFASIGLALAVRGAPKAVGRERIREAFRLDRAPERRGAHAIALGLAEERAEAPAVSKAYRDAASLSQRVELSEALALFRAGEGREALLEMLERDRSNVGRSQAAFALGFHCDPRDVRPLGEALRRNSTSTLMGPYSLGLGFHGSEAAVEELLRVLERGKAEPIAAAAAIDALAVALQEDPIPTLHRVARGSNYEADPPFVLEALEFLL